MNLLKEIAGFFGGALGVVYLVGYTMLASHQRALGITLRITDMSTVASSAWEFLYGTVLALITAFFESVPAAWSLLRWFYLIPFLALMVSLWYFRRRQALWRVIRSWAPVATLVFGLLGGVLHFARDTLPLMAIGSLLRVRVSSATDSPFGYLPEFPGTFLRARWLTLSMAIQSANGPELRRAFAWHVALIGLLVVLGLLLRRFRFTFASIRSFLLPANLLFALAVMHALVTPVYYGVLLKNYRYPKAQVVMESAGETKAVDFQLYETPAFLLGMTASEVLLYDASTNELIPMDRRAIRFLRVSTTPSPLFE